jgi:hypothetical protein
MRRLKLICVPGIFAAATFVAGCQGAANSTASTGSEAAGKDALAPAKPVEELRELTIPTGTTFTVALDDSVGSATSRVEDPVRAHVIKPVSLDGVVAVPAGSKVSGTVVEAVRSGRVKGLAHVGIRFDTLRTDGAGETYTIQTAEITRTAKPEKKKDAAKIGGAAAAGAVVGGLLGGGKGALIGGAVGGGGGTAYVMSERGQEVGIAHGATVSMRLMQPVSVHVRTGAAN